MSDYKERKNLSAEKEFCMSDTAEFAEYENSAVRIHSGNARRYVENGSFPFLAACALSRYGTGIITADLRSEEESLPVIGSMVRESLLYYSSVPVLFLQSALAGICSGKKPSEGFFFLERHGALELFLPELAQARGVMQNRFHLYDVFDHSVFSLDAVAVADLSVRLAALFHDLGKTVTRRENGNGEASFHNHELVSAKMAAAILKRFRFPAEFGKKTVFLVRNHMFHYTDEWTDKAVRRFAAKTDPETLNNLIQLRLADRTGSGKRSDLPHAVLKLMNHIEAVKRKEAELKVRDLAIGGIELMNLGMEPGPRMGMILKDLLELVKSGKIENERNLLLLKAREMMHQKNDMKLS